LVIAEVEEDEEDYENCYWSNRRRLIAIGARILVERSGNEIYQEQSKREPNQTFVTPAYD
jgi:hypothetical protein